MNKVGFYLLASLAAAAAALGYTVTVAAGDVTLAPAELAGFAGYHTITLAGGKMIPVAPGAPDLPGILVNVALPPGMEIAGVEVEAGEPRALAGSWRLMPMQEPTPVGEKAGRLVGPDMGIYGSAKPFPGALVWSFASGNAGGYQLGSVLLAPVQYIPAEGKVMVYEEIEFHLTLRPSTEELAWPRLRLGWLEEGLRRDLAAQVLNPAELVPAPGMKVVTSYDGGAAEVYPYLLITDATLETAAQTLATWKTKKGYRAKVLTTATINSSYPGVDLAEKVRNCIKDYFTNYGTLYVCLVGDKNLIPVRSFYDPQFQTQEGTRLVPSDNYYGCLDGTFNANNNTYWGEYPGDDPDFTYDVYVGRLQVSTAAALNVAADKTLCYEGSRASTFTNPYDFQHKVILAGAWLDSNTNERFLMEYVRDNYLTSSHWAFTALWDTTYPGGQVFNASAFISQMNAGHGLIAHAAHSNTTILGTNSGSVTSSNLYALTNKPRFTGCLYSLGCYPGNFDSTSNCALNFINAPNGGGVGMVANTRYGWYSPGSPANGYSADFLKEFYNQFGPKNVYVTGKTLAEHKHALQGMVSDWVYRYIYYELNLTGDPELAVPTAAIKALAVTHANAIPTGPQDFTVTVAEGTDGPVAGALVCVWKGTEVYATGVTNASGQVTLSINPTTNGTMYLTVTAHNYRTYEADVTVGLTGITLSSFSGRRTAAGVLLSWQVAGASGPAFNLYRRPAGEVAVLAAGEGGAGRAAASRAGAAATTDGGWVKVNSHLITGRNPFSFLDRQAPAGDFEYRLELVKEEQATALGETTVRGVVPTAFGLRIYPNPATTKATAAVGLPAAARTKLVLYDVAGRKVKELVNGRLAAGEHEINVEVGALPEGLYLLRLTTDDNAATGRLAVIH